MITILQLNPTIPVIVTSKQNTQGYAFLVQEISQEHDTLWAVASDEDGSIWWIPNHEIRIQKNWSLGRRTEIEGGIN